MTTSLTQALKQVNAAANEEWKEHAYAAITLCAETYRTFTSDQVWGILDLYPDVQTHEPRALGPLMLRAVREGLIESSDCEVCGTEKVVRKSQRPAQHSAEIVVYRSLIKQ